MNAVNHGNFISSENVEGTDVYSSSDREKVGTIHHLVIDRVSGNVAYADMSFGGFLGIGEEHHRIPWQALKYDTQLEGYVTGITEDLIKSAPPLPDGEVIDRHAEDRLHEHFRVRGYWAGVA